MADNDRPYTWFPTSPSEEVAITMVNSIAPSWYVPPAEEEAPINRENEYNIPSYYYPTEISSILEDGNYNQHLASNINRGKNFPYAKDLGATGVYTSYAGTDIVATMVIPGETEPIEIGELQTISYSIHRENVPVRVLGRVGPRGFVKGPRTIAGSLIFTQFDKYFFYKLSNYRRYIDSGLYPLSDMLPPFDVTVSFANESGSFSKLKIYGITFVDEGSTMSVDDLITEQTFTYMARGIQPLVNYIPSEIKQITNLDYLINRNTILGTVKVPLGATPNYAKISGSEKQVEISRLRAQLAERQMVLGSNEIKLKELRITHDNLLIQLNSDPNNTVISGAISATNQEIDKVGQIISTINKEIDQIQNRLLELDN